MQVRWVEQIDEHALFLTRGESEIVLATHHNGYSCHALAERMIKGEIGRSEAQAQYIGECGGLTQTIERIRQYVIEVALPTSDPRLRDL